MKKFPPLTRFRNSISFFFLYAFMIVELKGYYLMGLSLEKKAMVREDFDEKRKEEWEKQRKRKEKVGGEEKKNNN